MGGTFNAIPKTALNLTTWQLYMLTPVIATMAALMTQTDVNTRQYMERMDMIMAYMELRKFPRELFRKVRVYYRHYYRKKTALDEQQILHELSPNLRDEVANFLASGVFETQQEMLANNCFLRSLAFS